MHSFNRNEKIFCVEIVVPKLQESILRVKKIYSAGSRTCSSCANFSTKSRAEMKYHTAKKHPKATATVEQKYKNCEKNFHSFYNL